MYAENVKYSNPKLKKTSVAKASSFNSFDFII